MTRKYVLGNLRSIFFLFSLHRIEMVMARDRVGHISYSFQCCVQCGKVFVCLFMEKITINQNEKEKISTGEQKINNY